MAGSTLSEEVKCLLKKADLTRLEGDLEALGVKNSADLALVDDSDLKDKGCTVIERRRFFGYVRELIGSDELDKVLKFGPPSTWLKTRASHTQQAVRPRRPENTIRVDPFIDKGSAKYQVPRVAERILAATGDLDISELAIRVAAAEPALAQAVDANQWPQFVEAHVRNYSRLVTKDNVVSICSSVFLSTAEEVIGDKYSGCWARILAFLNKAVQVAVVACLCRASREVADGPDVWSRLLARWYPKATLLNPDWVAQGELEKRLEQALENDFARATLTKRLQPDTPLDIGDLIRALPQQTTPKALVKFMSQHPENFKQSPDGKQFCISRTPDDLRNCKDWRTVNPFQQPPVPKDGSLPDIGVAQLGKSPLAEGKPFEQPREVCQQLHPKVAYRLYAKGMLSQTSRHSKRGKLEAWEYHTESDSKCTMAAGDLLDLAEERVKSVRTNDPAVVHELVLQTLEGMIKKVPFGYWYRRVKILTMALNASQLRLGHEQRKQCERKQLEFMEWVKKERGFGYYQCSVCGSRWKSGFSHEEITQTCRQCDAKVRPFRIQDLETAQEREARERGEVFDPQLVPTKTSMNTNVQPAVAFQPPVLQHTREDTRAMAKRSVGWVVREPPSTRPRLVEPPVREPPRARPRLAEPPRHTPCRGSRASSTASGNAEAEPPPRTEERQPPASIPEEDPMQAALRAALGLIEPEATANVASSSSAGIVRGAVAVAPAGGQYTPGRGGFFANQSASSSAAPGAAAAVPAGAAASEPTARAYTPGGGGFFANQRASSAAAPGAAVAETTGTTATEAAARAAAQPAARAVAEAARAAAESTSRAYAPGGGGFFANRRASNSATPGAAAAETAGATGTEAAPRAAAEPAARAAAEPTTRAYTPGGGGFFANRRPSDSAAPGATAVEAAGAAAAEPAGTSAGPPARAYTPGGGGFFANRRASSSTDPGARDTSRDSNAASTIATAGPVSSSPDTSAGDSSIAGARDTSRDSTTASTAAAVGPVSGSPDTSTGDSSMATLAASLGLSVEEAMAMGLLSNSTETAAESSTAGKADADKDESADNKAAHLAAEASAKAEQPHSKSDVAAKVDADRLDAEKAEVDQPVVEAASKVEQERLVAETAAKTENDRIAAKKTEAERVAAEEAHAKAEADRLATEASAKAEQERLKVEAVAKVEADRLAAEKAEADRLASETAAKAEADRIAAKKAEVERVAAEEAAAKVEADRLAAEVAAKAEQERLKAEAAAKAEADRLAVEKAEADRLAAEAAAKIEAERIAAQTAETERLAAGDAAKTEEDRLAVEAAAKAEQERLKAESVAKVETDKPAEATLVEAAKPDADRPVVKAAAKEEPDHMVIEAAAKAEQDVEFREPKRQKRSEDGRNVDVIDDGNTETAMVLDVDYSASDCSDAVLVEAINAVVTFRDAGGNARIIAPQASDAAYLVSDSVFWPLLRRLAAEMSVLEAGMAAYDTAVWDSAPASSEDAVRYAETRGYLLPVGLATPAASSSWRRVLLNEAATDLMLTRTQVGRGLDLPALAGPSGTSNSQWHERPSDSLEGIASKVDAESGDRVAKQLVAELEAALPDMGDAKPPSKETEPEKCDVEEEAAFLGKLKGVSKRELKKLAMGMGISEEEVNYANDEDDAMAAITQLMLARRASSKATAAATTTHTAPSSGSLPDRLGTIAARVASDTSKSCIAKDGEGREANGPALRGGWTLLQEMGVREAAVALREEYGIRRQILLNRLDVTVQTMIASDLVTVLRDPRRATDILARMWAGWRRTAGEAPPLSEWSALAATGGMLARAMDARVSAPHVRVISKVKSFRMVDAVPDRGGTPEGYAAKTNAALQASGAKAVPAGTPRPRPSILTSGGASSSSAGASDGAGAASRSGDRDPGPRPPARLASDHNRRRDSVRAGPHNRQRAPEQDRTYYEKLLTQHR